MQHRLEPLYSPSSYYDINGTGNSAVIGTYNSQQGNAATTWETDKVANVGLDVTIINKIDFSLDVYKKSVSGLLFQQSAFAYNLGASQPFSTLATCKIRDLILI